MQHAPLGGGLAEYARHGEMDLPWKDVTQVMEGQGRFV
jgi:hypothetical protein